VIPCYVSTDEDGDDPREFLDGYFPDSQRLFDAIFLKGYQWPFDSRKIENYGSSLIDLLVYQEIHQKNRRVFLDYRSNPAALQADFSNLGSESYTYLKNSGTLQSTPIERLAHLNQPAIDLYKNNGIDLTTDLLEIAVCAQHNNGGLAVNCWWETNVSHFFAVGEAAGTHGIYRPGGSALNSGQVGSTRAALYIARRYTDKPMPKADFLQLSAPQIAPKLELLHTFLGNRMGIFPFQIRYGLGTFMSKYAAHIRHPEDIRKVKEYSLQQLQVRVKETVLSRSEELIEAFENVDLLIAEYVYACAMENYISVGGGSRGSCIIPAENGICPVFDILKFTPDNGSLSSKIQEVHYTPQGCEFNWEDVRPIPQHDEPFETVWKQYRADEGV
jgi:succinate dehydrogenase/fumarate reductase flavoprotein subunit